MTIQDGLSEVDTLRIEIPSKNDSILNLDNFSYTRDFLDPTDTWNFTVSTQNPELVNKLLIPGIEIKIYINDVIQTTGYIASKDWSSDPQGGNTINVGGRDLLGRLVDANIDPKLKFTSGQTLEEVV